MQKTILSDTSCLILFEKIGELNLLNQVFGEITITQVIADEYGLTIPNWISIQNPIDKKYQRVLEASVDKGEASAIALAVELIDCLLIIDDLKGRNLADAIGIKITGTFGVILEAKLSGKINSVKPLLAKIKQTNFRLSDKLEKQILTKANES
jgi:predicted nucleic acid-binding protein